MGMVGQALFPSISFAMMYEISFILIEMSLRFGLSRVSCLVSGVFTGFHPKEDSHTSFSPLTFPSLSRCKPSGTPSKPPGMILTRFRSSLPSPAQSRSRRSHYGPNSLAPAWTVPTCVRLMIGEAFGAATSFCIFSCEVGRRVVMTPRPLGSPEALEEE